MKKFLCILFLLAAVVGMSAQITNNGMNISEKEKYAEVIYSAENSEIKIINPVDTDYSVRIYNLTGVEVKRIDNIKPGVSRVSASELKKGVYLLKVSPAPNNVLSATFKVMIK